MKLKEKTLLNWFKENNIANYKKIKRGFYDIHYHFYVNERHFSIISNNQFSRKQLNKFKAVNYCLDGLVPKWYIYCFDFNNNDEQYDLNDFHKFIRKCVEKKGK